MWGDEEKQREEYQGGGGSQPQSESRLEKQSHTTDYNQACAGPGPASDRPSAVLPTNKGHEMRISIILRNQYLFQY